MTRTLAAALLIAVPTVASAAERRFTLTDFDRVVVEGPFLVSVTTGRGSSGIATGDPRALDTVSLDVQGRTLRVRPNRSNWGGYPGEAAGAPRIAVTTPALRGALVNGSGGLQIDKVKTMRFDAALTGNGRIGIGAIEADFVHLGAIGGGKLSVAGTARNVRASIRGTADLDAAGLRAEALDLQAETSGSIDMAAVKTAKVTTTGTGDVTVTGSPACTVHESGAGRVSCGQ